MNGSGCDLGCYYESRYPQDDALVDTISQAVKLALVMQRNGVPDTLIGQVITDYLTPDR